ncbi:winged helix-turn-helix transcriptional regulator [Candidatus Bathyarchaeota archaeon]|nr:winged helix-turn-helix transcriptional regulator [Candidatus Bathyarchaeota archaeon]
MFLTIKQKILVTLLEEGPLQNSDIAKRVGITEQWCSEMINALHMEGLIESQIITPRRINKLTNRGSEVAKHLKGISENITGQIDTTK